MDRLARFNKHKSDNRYLEMKKQRPALMARYIQEGKMADPTKTYGLDEAIAFVGECQTFCPEFEMEEREYTNFLEPFEKV